MSAQRFVKELCELLELRVMTPEKLAAACRIDKTLLQAVCDSFLSASVLTPQQMQSIAMQLGSSAEAMTGSKTSKEFHDLVKSDALFPKGEDSFMSWYKKHTPGGRRPTRQLLSVLPALVAQRLEEIHAIRN